MKPYTSRHPSQHLCSVFSLIASWLLLTPVAADNTASSDPTCDCYLVSGPDAGYFTHHQFIDFRNLNGSFPSRYNLSATPTLIGPSATAGSEPPTNSYFSVPNTPFTSFFSIENNTGLFNWSDGGVVPQVASAQNVWISGPQDPQDGPTDTNSSTFLAMRTTRTPMFQSVSEIDSLEKDMLYLSLRARVRIVPQNDGPATKSVVDAGGVFGLFTYESDTQESDLEILSRDDASSIHLTNQPDVNSQGDEIQGATEEVQLPDNLKWVSWVDLRVDWFKGQSCWYVNGASLWNSTKNVPTQASGVVLNVWSDGGSWSGNMTVGGELVVGVQYIEVAYNVSSDSGKGGVCGVGCSLDSTQVKNVGTPVVAYQSTATGAAVSGRSFGGSMLGLAVLCSVLMGVI